MDKLYFGTGGIPLSTEPRNTENGIVKINELGLGSMELEFVRNITISKEKAPQIKKISEDENVKLTAHASYFINLNAADLEKRNASRSRLVAAAKTLHACGGYSVCVHSAYRLDSSKEDVFKNVKEQFEKAIQECKDEKINVWLRPETAGKYAQFGTIDELIEFSQGFDRVLPCIDFSHVRATTDGRVNNYDEYCKILDKLETGFGRKLGLEEMHLHIQGVNFGDKGEKNHLTIEEDPKWNYGDLMKALKDYDCKGCVTVESPNLETDALLLKNCYEES
ncbi:TIM barrel protein [Candidatus Micrarchaeota archaeon]|nr:TIM barrel protein [Candidatus Micrarchaeota archaeon]